VQIKREELFDNSLKNIVLYIAKDSKNRAHNYKNELKNKINKWASRLTPLRPKRAYLLYIFGNRRYHYRLF